MSGNPIAAAIEQAEAPQSAHTWPDPEPLPPPMPPAPEFAPELLPGALRPWIQDIAERVQCPMDYPAVVAMTALGSVVGRQIGIHPKRHDDWLVVPNVWGAIVGRPGVMKSPAMTEALRPLHQLESEAREAYERAAHEYQADKLLAEAASKAAKKQIEEATKKRDMHAARMHALAAMEEPEAPVRRRYTTQDPTVEKLGELLRDNPRGVLVARDELVGWLRGLDKEGHESARAFYLEAWSGTGRYTYDRIGRGTIEIEAATVSLIGGIQPGPLEDYLRAALRGGVGDDGLMQRIQLCVWPDMGREWKNVDRYPDREAKQAAYNLFARLNDIDASELGADTASDIPALRFDADAQAVFDKWRAELEQRLRDPDSTEPDAFISHLAKFRSLVPSLALLYHLASDRTGPVDEEGITAAIAWGEFLEAHARRVYGTARTPELRAAYELERRLHKGDLTTPFIAREVHRKGWRALDRESVSRCLEYLEDLGRVRAEHHATGGRNKTLWHVHPAVMGG
ncbi:MULTISPECIES: YfjI family protein [unclassified Thioalkalivibrio]|uniref:YfjI family protein n=1 Tax=unclassified Thioalkalivibrio TaxID=2621013 RepID=UPI001E5F9601|nr:MULTISPECIES: YfjI family protein [unclassified Thioalkalivibrio]